jgi:hypothetical protein
MLTRPGGSEKLDAHTVQQQPKAMRTKTLLAAAAVIAAGAVTSLAQSSNVYSQNIVGYVTQVYPAGFSMIATPLKTTNNTVVEIITGLPAGGSVYKFSAGSFSGANTYFGGGFWGDGTMTLPPGQGYFVRSSTPWTNTFVGEVVKDSTNVLIAGFNLVGSAYPMAGAIDTNLSLVPVAGDGVYVYTNGMGYAGVNTYFGGGFWGGGNPQLSVAQGVFYKSVGANNWIQHFNP